MKFSETMFAYHAAESVFEDALCDAGFAKYERIGGDHYDNSIEFYEVSDEARMPEAAQKVVYDAGFSIAYVNHKDGWETIYTLDQKAPFQPQEGWRRRYVSDSNATTTNVIAGMPNPGYYEVNRFPELWPAEWLENGYVRVVP